MLVLKSKPKNKMGIISDKAHIQRTFKELSTFSFNEKKITLNAEERINELLDSILDFKKSLKDKTQEIYDINEKLEKLTWFNNLDEACLMTLNDLISLAKDLRTTLIRRYVAMNHLRTRGVANAEIKDFKNALDEMKESYEDLESVFFYLPKMPEFVETSRRLSLIA
jgi:uncharacterized protein YutE (UPF0331/DUF86 family)